jgi:arabinogalactan endo-1,4-beta-galactosidase
VQEGRDMASRHPVRAAVGAATAVAVVGAAGILGTGTPASALFGEAVINPIESNIAAKFWASTAASSGAGTAALAIDQDPATAWLADGSGPDQWLTLDLGGRYDNIRKVEVVFPDPGAVYQYVVEASGDGEDWQAIADRSRASAASRGAVHLVTAPGARYLRVTITGHSPGAAVGVSELKAFNYLRDELVLGADLSWVDDFQSRAYWVHPGAADQGAGPFLLDVVKDRGFEFIRLRIWNEPRSETTGNLTAVPRQGPERSLTSARWIEERGMGLGIDFHYADSWADPGKQPKPRAWAELPFDELVEAMYDFTYDYIRRLVDQGTTPDKVAVGNEIINGFLYGSEAALIGTTNPPYFSAQADIYQSQPGGGLLWRYWNSTDPVEQRLYDEAWDRFTTLSAAGIKAVRDASPETTVETHVIVDTGRLAKTMEFWDQYLTRVNAKGQDPDVLAISYYPEWHGTPEMLDENLHTITTTYPDYEVEVAETSYPASGGGGTPMPNSPFPRTVQGQADAIQRVFQAVNDVVNNAGVGVLTWEPASFQTMFRFVPGMTNTWEPHSSIDVYTKSAAKQVVESVVYASTLVGAAPALPSTVDVLTTADGSVDSVPVSWDAAPAGAFDVPGQVTVAGGTEFGPVSAIVDVLDAYTAAACDRVLTGRQRRVTVSSGVTCLDGATVTGAVTVLSGAGLQVTGGRITGPVTAHGAAVVSLCGVQVTGPVTLVSGSSVTVGNPVLGCLPNPVSGPVTVAATDGWDVIAGNSIIGPLSCLGNDPAPVNNGYPNTVLGPKTGQCSGL